MSGLFGWLRGFGRADVESAAAAVAKEAFAEPKHEEVAWLTALMPSADADHACWELRYARRALALLSARRDALDDRTPSMIARAIDAEMERDPLVDASKRDLAARQFNARLRTYGEVLDARTPVPLRQRLGIALLAFAEARRSRPDVERAGEFMLELLDRANASLRSHFGTAALPEDVAPSELARRGGGS